MYIFFYLCRKQCKYEYLFVFELIFLYYNTVLLRVKWWAKECCQKTVSNLSLPCYRYSYHIFYLKSAFISYELGNSRLSCLKLYSYIQFWIYSEINLWFAVTLHYFSFIPLRHGRNQFPITQPCYLIYSFETWQESIPHHSTLLLSSLVQDLDLFYSSLCVRLWPKTGFYSYTEILHLKPSKVTLLSSRLTPVLKSPSVVITCHEKE